MNHLAFPEIWLTTLDALKLHRGINSENTPADGKYDPEEIDWILKQCILDASASVVDELARLPLPHRLTNYYPGVSSSSLYVPDDLLQVVDLIDAAGDAVDSADYFIAPYNRYPKRQLELTPDCSRYYWWSPTVTTQRITLTGIFGYVPHWDRAWKTSGQVIPGTPPGDGIDDSETEIVLEDVTAFQIGGYGRIEDEYVQFIGRDDTESIITLERGVLGTAAETHVAGTSIELFIQHADIQTKTTEWAAFLYKSLDQLGEEIKVFSDGVQFVKGLSPLIRRALRKHKRL